MLTRMRGICGLVLVTMVGAATSSSAQSRLGTILVAHGASHEWNVPVLEVAGLARTGGPVEVSFLMGPAAPEHRFQDAVTKLASQGVDGIVIVPVLVSSHSGHYEQIRFLAGETDELPQVMMHHLHMADIERPDVPVPLRLTKALDDSPELARILAERALQLAEEPREQALYLIGHGPNSAEDHAAWMRNLRVVADSVRSWTGFLDVKVGLLRDDAPAEVRAEAVLAIRETIELQHRVTERPVVVVPVLISSGGVSLEKVPNDLSDLPVVYRGDPLLPSAGMVRWVEARVRAASGTNQARQ